MNDRVTLTLFQFNKLVEENNRLRDVVYELATTAPYEHKFTEAIYLSRQAILGLGLSGYCQGQYRLPRDIK